jgi:hypothetical protein
MTAYGTLLPLPSFSFRGIAAVVGSSICWRGDANLLRNFWNRTLEDRGIAERRDAGPVGLWRGVAYGRVFAGRAP